MHNMVLCTFPTKLATGPIKQLNSLMNTSRGYGDTDAQGTVLYLITISLLYFLPTAALFVSDTSRVPRNRSVSASAATSTEEGVALQGRHDDMPQALTSILPSEPPMSTLDTTALSRV